MSGHSDSYAKDIKENAPWTRRFNPLIEVGGDSYQVWQEFDQSVYAQSQSSYRVGAIHTHVHQKDYPVRSFVSIPFKGNF